MSIDTHSGRSPQASSILLVTGSLQGGGAERVLSGMANFWASIGVDVTLATWSSADVEDVYSLDERVTRVWLADSPGPDAKSGRLMVNVRRIFTLRAMIKTARPNVVLSFMTTSNVLAVLAGMGLGVRVVISERTDPSVDPRVGRIWRLLRRRMYRHADLVVVQSIRAATWVRDYCNCTSEVLPNPLRRLPDIDKSRELVVVAVGRLAIVKGFDILLRAFSNISDSHPDWQVVIVGEGDERPALENLRTELGLDGRVSLVGYSDEVESWMARAGIVVQPSRFEGFPNVLLEGMGMGAAVISSDVSSAADIIDDGVNGRVIPVEDPAALAAAMSDLMADASKRSQLGIAATSVRQRFGEATVMRLWEKCLFGTQLDEGGTLKIGEADHRAQ